MTCECGDFSVVFFLSFLLCSPFSLIFTLFFFLLASFELVFSYFFCVLVKHIKLNSSVPLVCLLRGDTCVCFFIFFFDRFFSLKSL